MRTAGPIDTLAFRDAAHQLARERDGTVAVCVPTVDEAGTIGRVVRELVALRAAGAIDRVIVLDDSTDATPQIAERWGAEVVRQADLLPQVGAVRGKGDAMWRGLSIVEEDVIAFVDGDTIGFDAHMAADLVAAVALEGRAFVKATYRRPFRVGTVTQPTGGGRVTELTAKPLLAHLVPELAGFDQPLAGEIAGRTSLLRALPFVTGYGVDVALLIDAARSAGVDALAQVDTGVRQNRHRPLEELGAMAGEVSASILGRAGVAIAGAPAIERPPLLTLTGAGVGSSLPSRPTPIVSAARTRPRAQPLVGQGAA